ncbi:MAG TPA: lipocalin-like domain-containing protein [Gammaproteobacteria bacterium]|nr:lipocalin-like domain-containing protein [Gammaproteobacteria bacterium]
MRRSTKLSENLLGTWKLVSREDRTHQGALRVDPALGADPVAILTYDRGGYFAAQFMKRERNPATEVVVAKAGPNNSRTVGGYDAYFGTFTVDDANGTVTQRLEGALSPESVGQVLTREMTVNGDELVIQLETAGVDGEPVIRILKWQRVA